MALTSCLDRSLVNDRTRFRSESLDATASQVFAWLGATCPRAEAPLPRLDSYAAARAALAVPGARAAAYANVVFDVVREVQIRPMRSSASG